MPIHYYNGSVFNSNAQLLVNTVNLDGIMGKGLALEFKLRYPDVYTEYIEKCSQGEIAIGKNFLHSTQNQKILSFATKTHWRAKSKIGYIEKGLDDFIKNYQSYEIQSVAFPKLGSGLGGLDWPQVAKLMESKLSHLDIGVAICLDNLPAAGVESSMINIFFKEVREISKGKKSSIKSIASLPEEKINNIINVESTINRFYQILNIPGITSNRYERLFKEIYNSALELISSSDTSDRNFQDVLF